MIGSFLLLFLVPLVVLLVAGALMLRPIGQILRIRRAPTVPVGMLPDSGPAEIYGRAAGDTRPSPLAQAPCLFWQIEVQEYRSSGKSGHWRTIFRQASTEPFAIDDGTGSVQVLPEGASLTLVDDLRATRGLFGNMTDDLLAAIERLGVQTSGFLGFQRRLRVFERHILPGEQVYALGYVERLGAGPLIRSIPDAPLLLADRSEKGVLHSLYARVGLAALVPVAVAAIALFLLISIRGGP